MGEARWRCRVEGHRPTARWRTQGELNGANWMQQHVYFVYMLAPRPYGTLYVGVTNDLIACVYEHRSGETKGFTSRYGVHQLVWFETHADINAAIDRENLVKRWRRDWKINLIETENRHWEDLYPKLLDAGWRAERD
jgi:putative endonuclease